MSLLAGRTMSLEMVLGDGRAAAVDAPSSGRTVGLFPKSSGRVGCVTSIFLDSMTEVDGNDCMEDSKVCNVERSKVRGRAH